MECKMYCKYCGENIDADSIVCSKCGKRLDGGVNIAPDVIGASVQPKWLSALTWLALLFCPPLALILLWMLNKHFSVQKKVILTLIFLVWSGIFYSSNKDASDIDTNRVAKNNAVKVAVADFSTMSESSAAEWCTANKLNCKINTKYSDTVAKGTLIHQSKTAGENVSEGSDIDIAYSIGKEPSIEFKNALKTAETYSKTLHMSKRAIFSQLTSEYGEGFPKDAAQYAVDNLKADYKYNALQAAKNYSENMHMSKNAIFNQLISDYGEKFTREEAQYAVDNMYK